MLRSVRRRPDRHPGHPPCLMPGPLKAVNALKCSQRPDRRASRSSKCVALAPAAEPLVQAVLADLGRFCRTVEKRRRLTGVIATELTASAMARSSDVRGASRCAASCALRAWIDLLQGAACCPPRRASLAPRKSAEQAAPDRPVQGADGALRALLTSSQACLRHAGALAARRGFVAQGYRLGRCPVIRLIPPSSLIPRP